MKMKSGKKGKNMPMYDREKNKGVEYQYNSHMDNDGASAKMFATALTKGMDKAEYPMKGSDKSDYPMK